MSTLTGAAAIVRALEHEGVETTFGLPGGAIISAYDTLLDSPIRHILARHEQGAGHMAEGYAQATGRVGVAIVTSGPGATNLVTPLQNALVDSVPMVAISGQVATSSLGNDAFQEADTSGLAMHCTKHSYLVTDPDDIGEVVHEAFYLASSGRPGPVLIDVPKDVLAAPTGWQEPGPVSLPGYRPARAGHPRQVRRAIEMLQNASRPVIYAGGGVIKAGAHAELRRLAEAARAPVVTTLMARGAFPDTHELALGMPGMHGTYAATTAMQKADLLFTLGARFDDRVTGDPDAFAPLAEVVHVDIDPAEIGKVRAATVPIVGDIGAVLRQLVAEIEQRPVIEPTPARLEWLETVGGMQRDHPLAYHQDPNGPIKPQFVIEQLHEATGGDAVVVAGVGQHQMWASLHWRFTKPRSWINSGGLGTMGYAVPAAVGAKVGRPDDLVYAIDGDGCFQMTSQELITAATHGIPVKVAVLNNQSLGMVRQWQTLLYDGRHSATDLTHHTPDYVMLAEAMGCIGLRAETPDEVAPAIEKSLYVDDRPVVVEFQVDRDEMVFPMVPAGRSNDHIALGPEDMA
jgi:acetolactate synthase-1/2/3 large subunit